MDDFVLRSLLAGWGIAAVAGPLGSFIVWRRMAYFGDTLAHAALLGVALGFLLDINITAAVVALSAGLALLLVALQQQRRLPSDTLLGILSHGALAFGLVAFAFLETVRVDLLAYLFGDILAVTRADLLWVYAGGAAVLVGLLLLWRPLLAMTVHEEMAQVDGINVVATRMGFVLLVALVIAAGMKIVGALMIGALLILPAAAARRFAQTPEQMAIAASGIGIVAVTLGLAGSLRWDTPAGPSIVAAAALIYGATALVPRRRGAAR